MAERVLIDGMNLFRSWPETRNFFTANCDIGGALRRSLDLLAKAANRNIRHWLVIIDGGQAAEVSSHKGLKAVNAGPGRSADAEILSYLRKADNPRACQVITNDRELAAQARALGAKTTSVSDFIAGLSASAASSQGTAKTPRLSEAEVSEWLEIFGDGKDNQK